MFNTKIKLKKDLTERIKRCAKAGGYSSAEEFIEQILTRELVKLEDAESDKEIVKKLRLKKDLTERIKRCAEAEGYSSAQEFVEHTLTRERPLPGLLEARLAERGGRLQLRQRAGTPFEPEVWKAERDRTRGHDRDRLAAGHDRGDLSRAPPQDGRTNGATLACDEARAELDDDRHRVCEPSPTIRYWRSQRSR